MTMSRSRTLPRSRSHSRPTSNPKFRNGDENNTSRHVSSTRNISPEHKNDKGDMLSNPSSDPLALSDGDISPFRPLKDLPSKKKNIIDDPGEDDRQTGSNRNSNGNGFGKGKRKQRELSSSSSDSIIFVERVKPIRNATPGPSKRGRGRRNPRRSIIASELEIRNAEAGPSRRGNGRERKRINDYVPELSSDSLESVSESDGKFRTQKRPRRQASASVQRGNGRIEPVVEIPLIPFPELWQYTLNPGGTFPTQGSRDLLRGLTPVSSSAEDTDSGSIKKKARTNGRRIEMSLSFDDDDNDDDDQLGSYDDDGGSESDEIALRRSGRNARSKYIGHVEEKKVSERTRSKWHEDDFHREPLYISSAVSEDAFYGHGQRRKFPAPARSMAVRSGKLPPKSKARSKVRKDDYSMSSQGEDELDEDEDDDNLSESDSASDYGKRKGRARAKTETKTIKKEEKEVDESVLSNHRPFCEKCSREPADDILEKAQARKSKGKGRKKKTNDDEISDEELAEQLEGWLECTNCVVSTHWGCLTPKQQKDVLTMLAEREGPKAGGERPRRSVKIDESTIFTCPKCEANDKCFVCHNISLVNGKDEVKEDKTEPMEVDEEVKEVDVKPKAGNKPRPLSFRCLRCKQSAHYEHLEVPDSLGNNPSVPRVADHYQTRTEDGAAWYCHQCRHWIWTVDMIIAWRPSPADAKEEPLEPDEFANWKNPLPREYLVKWTNRGFRHTTWASHAWLQVIAAQRLRNFLVKGPSLDLITDASLAAKGDEMAEPTIARILEEDDQVTGSGGRSAHHHHSQADANGEQEQEWVGGGPGPDVDAEASIPTLWSTIDRVLDVMLLPPPATTQKKKPQIQQRRSRIISVSVTPSEDSRQASPTKSVSKEDPRVKLGLKDGLRPPNEMMVDIDDWEDRTGRMFRPEDVDEVADMVTWCFVKWDDLQYDQSTWDTPPPIDSPLYPAFKRALERYLRARQIDVPVLTGPQAKKRDTDAERAYVPPQEQPDCIVGGKLMPFQLEGVQWLMYNYFKRHSCILADDMGLGKTVQIASFLGYLGSEKHRIYPSLVVVPNSTITNWVREFEKWVPHMQVVPYYGEAASRKVISKYELYHKGLQGKAAGLRAHVVLTTYDMITGNEFRVFAGIPRWEVLCIDEGQRLKSDNSLIFNRLKTLNSIQRILLTGTPLNNNLRELFNLLNFLDPETFKELFDLEKRFENLNEGLIQELHEMIKPYILRRIKADVLKLPPKVEIIVPITLTALQKQVYKGIFEKNQDLIKAIYQTKLKKARAT